MTCFLSLKCSFIIHIVCGSETPERGQLKRSFEISLLPNYTPGIILQVLSLYYSRGYPLRTTPGGGTPFGLLRGGALGKNIGNSYRKFL